MFTEQKYLNNNSDRESEDIDFDEEDEEADLEMLRKSYNQQKVLTTTHIPSFVKNTLPADINMSILRNVKNTFFEKHNTKNCIVNYIQHGSEINSYLRNPSLGENVPENSIKCLDNNSISLRTLLKDQHDKDYIVLYRSVRNLSGVGNPSPSFISTSNVLINTFGNINMKIFVPMSFKVLIGDISKHINRNNNDDTIFEIILPRNTTLIFVKEDEDINYYVAVPPEGINSENSMVIQNIIKKIQA